MTVTREREGKRTRTPRFTDDGGAVLAEAALITPVFIFLLFGILEFGGAFRGYLTLSNIVVTGTRQEAIWGSALQADWNALQAMKKGGSALDLDQVEYIAVWKAANGTDSVPAGCKNGIATFNGGSITAPAVGACNIFTPANMRDDLNGPVWTCSGVNEGPIKFYCPSGRKVTILEDPDYLGIYVKIKHPWITGLFGVDIVMSDQAVTKLDPQKLS